MIEHLDRSLYQPLIVLHQRGELAAFLSKRGLEYTLVSQDSVLGGRSGRLYQLWALITAIGRLVSFIHRHGVEVVHANDGRIQHTWAIPTRVAGRTFVWHQRTKFMKSRLSSVMMLFASSIVCISNFCKYKLPSRHQTNSVVIENPFVFFRKQSSSHPLNHPAERKVAFVGNLTPQKRPLEFLEAARVIVDHIPDPVCFKIYGADRAGFVREVERRITELDLENHVTLMGFVNPIEAEIAANDLILVPEVDDGFGRAIVEAMLVGTPVIASASGGHMEIIRDGETGYLTRIDDPLAMAQAAIKLLCEPELARTIAATAQSDARGRYSAERHANAVMNIYDRALAT